MKVLIVVFVLFTISVFSQTNQDFKVGDQVYYKQFGRCYKAKVTGIIANVPGYGRRIQILTESDGSSKKSNLMVDGSMKNTSLIVDPKDLSRKSDCGIISKKGYKVGDVLYLNDLGNCKKVEIHAIPDNTNQISVYIYETNSMSNVLEDKLSLLPDCGIQSKEGFKVGDKLYLKDFTGKCKQVEIKKILNASMISVYSLDGSNSMQNVNQKDLYKVNPCK